MAKGKQPKPLDEAPQVDDRPPAPRFLKLEDLARRWVVGIEDAKTIVRTEKVPYISLRTPGPGSMRLCWKFMRFEQEAIEAWEARRRMITVPLRPPPKPLFPPGHRPILRGRDTEKPSGRKG